VLEGNASGGLKKQREKKCGLGGAKGHVRDLMGYLASSGYVSPAQS